MRKRADGAASIGPTRAVTGLLAATIFVAVAGCATGGTVQDDTAFDDDRVQIQVENHDWATVHVYALGDGQSVSLGTLTTSQTTTFELPETITGTTRGVRLVADPVGSADAHVTPRIQFDPGDTIVYSIEDNLELSSISVR